MWCAKRNPTKNRGVCETGRRNGKTRMCRGPLVSRRTGYQSVVPTTPGSPEIEGPKQPRAFRITPGEVVGASPGEPALLNPLFGFGATSRRTGGSSGAFRGGWVPSPTPRGRFKTRASRPEPSLPRPHPSPLRPFFRPKRSRRITATVIRARQPRPLNDLSVVPVELRRAARLLLLLPVGFPLRVPLVMLRCRVAAWDLANIRERRKPSQRVMTKK